MTSEREKRVQHIAGLMRGQRATHNLYSPDLEWLLCESEQALGIRTSLASQIETLKRGAATSSYDPKNADPYTDWQVTSISPDGPKREGAFGRHRRVWRLWSLLSTEHRRVLSYHYAFTMRTKVKRGKKTEWQAFPPGVAPLLGQLAGVAIMVAAQEGDLGVLLRLCERRQGDGVVTWERRAEKLVSEAHSAYYAAEAGESDRWLRGA